MISAYLRIMRISNISTVVSNVITGILFIFFSNYPLVKISPKITVITVIIGCLLYTSGMVFNDICDLEWDRKNRNDRPLAKGEISKKNAWLLACFLLFLAYILCLFINIFTLLIALILTGFIFIYNLWHKNNSYSPIFMGICRMLLYYLGAFSLLNTITINDVFILIYPSLMLCFFIVLLSLIARFSYQKKFEKLFSLKYLLLVPILSLAGFSESNLFSWTILMIYSIVFLFINYYLKSNKTERIVMILISLIPIIDVINLLHKPFFPSFLHTPEIPFQISAIFTIFLLIIVVLSPLTLFLQKYVKGT